MSDSLELKLREPIKLDDQTYEILDIQEPTAGQLRDAYGIENRHAANIKLISLSAKVPQSVIALLPAPEYFTAMDWLEKKLQPIPLTGEK